MRIALMPHVPFCCIYGGAERQADETMMALRRRGHEVTWLDPSDRNLAEHTDIVHFFGASYYFADWIMLLQPIIPVALSSIFYETSYVQKSLWRVGRHVRASKYRQVSNVLLHSDAVLPNSVAEADQLHSLFGVPTTHMHVVPNGVDLDMIGGDSERFRKSYLPDMPYDEPFVLSAHRVERRKNTHLLVEACLRLGVPLVIAGQTNSSTQHDYVSRVMSRINGSSGKVRYIGPLSKGSLRDAYAAAHVHALPSTLETPGLASLEAGLNGCNLVVGRCQPVQEYLTGLAVLVRQDVQSIADGIALAMNSPRDMFGQASAISERYSWDEVISSTELAYDAAIHSR